MMMHGGLVARFVSTLEYSDVRVLKDHTVVLRVDFGDILRHRCRRKAQQ
jgi:hypothetical protein